MASLCIYTVAIFPWLWTLVVNYKRAKALPSMQWGVVEVQMLFLLYIYIICCPIYVVVNIIRSNIYLL